jgi:DNA mismatch repair protein MutS
LFAAAVPDETASKNDELSQLHKALEDINPDAMTPKQALEAIYTLKTLLPACAGEPK